MNREISFKKTIRSLKAKAKQGNFYSALQLSDYFKEGKFVDKDEAQSEAYLHKAFDIFKNQNLKVTELNIENFRLFDSLKLRNFDDNLNVFIGNNGAGKTTILDAIDLSLSWLSISINKNGGSGDFIELEDINIFNSSIYSTVTTNIKFNSQLSADIELSKSKDGRVKTRSKYSDIKKVGSFYKIANEYDKSFNLPLLSYYNVMRSYDVNPKDIKSTDIYSSTNTDKFDAYHKSLTGKTDFSSFFKWYKNIDDILSKRKANSDNVVAKGTLEINDDLLAKLSEMIHLGKDSLSIEDFAQLASQKSDEETDHTDASSASTSELLKVRELVNKVISNFMEGYSDIRVQVEPYLDLVIRKHNSSISVMKLSQGEKTLLALVLDIARRLIILNPSRENPLHGNGIVLIDEFDLHLHPKWQRELANKLVENFPNCQFFLTTHSPLVLSEVDPKHVFILEESNESVALVRPKQTFGLDSSDVLDMLMTPQDREQLSQSQFVFEKLEEISNLIDEETTTSLAHAHKLIDELEIQTKGSTPEIIKMRVRLKAAYEWCEDEED
ncbi:AAA family ATPase [Vibrio sp. Isolate33]|uniref:AAA family ATPase n=1 Tax=Vibrio sp. Isolate33 TaxID=2908539 RepID=UPI001EFE6553|nr:AAA family ATPase [Vibrio sp. Isolate33]MCG9544798.1 AAA family ATPase [Vibrio sp. Isolate33]